MYIYIYIFAERRLRRRARHVERFALFRTPSKNVTYSVTYRDIVSLLIHRISRLLARLRSSLFRQMIIIQLL